LFHKNIKPLGKCFCSICPGILETATHIFMDCCKVTEVWQSLGIAVTEEELQEPSLIGRGLPFRASVRLVMVILLLWRIWLSRNRLIFDDVRESTRQVVDGFLWDYNFWSCRFKRQEIHVLAWRDFL
ncbi:hypothetical protein BS78_K007300, partial [Paspalum vaginatum]